MWYIVKKMVTTGVFFSYRSSFKLVAVGLRLAELPLPCVPQVPVDREEDVGVGAAAVHITRHHWYFVCVSCSGGKMITDEHSGDTVEVIGRMQSEKKAIFNRSLMVLLEPRLIKGKLSLVSNWCSERRDEDSVTDPADIHVSEYKCSWMCCLLTYSPEHPPPRLRWLSGFRLVRVSQWWCRRAPAPSLFLHRPPTWRASTHMGRWRSLNPTERKRLRRGTGPKHVLVI